MRQTRGKTKPGRGLVRTVVRWGSSVCLYRRPRRTTEYLGDVSPIPLGKRRRPRHEQYPENQYVSGRTREGGRKGGRACSGRGDAWQQLFTAMTRSPHNFIGYPTDLSLFKILLIDAAAAAAGCYAETHERRGIPSGQRIQPSPLEYGFSSSIKGISNS